MGKQNKQIDIKSENCEDKIFEQQFESVKSFAFDQQVTDVFADMIKRSVPGYDAILKSIAMYCMQYASDNSNIYDLGCSWGAVALTAAKATRAVDCQIIAIDSSIPMVTKCQQVITDAGLADKVKVLQQDIVSMELLNASVVVSNFTLQFIPKKQRLKVVEKIYSGLNPGGVFILSEKFISNKGDDDFLIEHYHAYKKLNGYSNKAIQRKRQALKDVLIPDSVTEIKSRLQQAGFSQVVKWFQCFNFASFIAIKK
ncbi:MAG TPA: carboxy-S-adenosyl-L-methionine synthase CmoA [Oceanospirillales bacterium]|nr:carboxy-S-adenosyl-L-methionine synthase CmoA [Oceanospirillales bacterium]